MTPREMAAIDAAAPEPVDVLIGRAGSAVAWAARRMLGGTYGRRVVVMAGKGNNGNDGRAAAARLRRWGASVVEVEPAAVDRLPPADLVVDAAFGTGFRGEYTAPDAGAAAVLAVDIPSGVDGLTGETAAGVLAADRTVTFAALKPGLLLPPGCAFTGEVDVVDIGLDVSSARAFRVERRDVAAWLPPHPVVAHKWQRAVYLVAGSPGMTGAASLAARGAQRAGAGYVLLATPGASGGTSGGARGGAGPLEAVTVELPGEGWDEAALAGLDRFHALAVGPGLGRSAAALAAVRRLVAAAPVPVVVDGDGLSALADGDGPEEVLRQRAAPTVLTPHDGEYARLAGAPPPPDRVQGARDLAARLGAVVLLKGRATLVADPGGRVLISTEGGPRLATAGTGDVLTGIVAAFLAAGVDPAEAAAAAAYVHGTAGNLGWRRGLVAGDLPDLVPAALATITEA